MTAGSLSAAVPVTVLVGDVERLYIEPVATTDLSALVPGQTIRFTSIAEDTHGNRGQPSRWVVTPAWSVEGGIGTVDAGGQFVSLSDGSGRVVASFDGVTAGAELTVVLPSGVSEAEGALVQPGDVANVMTDGGFALTADDAVDVSTVLLLEVLDQPAGGLTLPTTVTAANNGVRISTPLGQLIRPGSLFVPHQASTTQSAAATLALLPYDNYTTLLSLLPIGQSANGTTVAVPPLIEPRTAARARQGNEGSLTVFGAGASRPNTALVLGPMSSYYSSGAEPCSYHEGYGESGSHVGAAWPRSGKVALVIHGIKSDLTKFVDSHMVDFLAGAPSRPFDEHSGGLGYDHVWGFQYEWRGHSMADNARILSDLLQTATAGSDAETDIFCHSMGGLIVRQMLEVTRAPGVQINRVVMMGTPNNGSVLAGTRFLNRSRQAGEGWLIDPLCFFGVDPVELILRAEEAAVSATASSRTIQQGVFGTYVEDMAPGSPFLQTLNATSGRARPVYYLLAGRLGSADPDQPGLDAWLRPLAGRLGAKIAGGGVVRSDIDDCFNNGDGVVPTASVYLASLDQEAGEFDGLLLNQPALRSPALGGCDHMDYQGSAEVRRHLRNWWFRPRNNLVIGIH